MLERIKQTYGLFAFLIKESLFISIIYSVIATLVITIFDDVKY